MSLFFKVVDIVNSEGEVWLEARITFNVVFRKNTLGNDLTEGMKVSDVIRT